MEWAVFEDKDTPGDWRVEATDHKNEGAVYVTVFSGPLAQLRAEIYASLFYPGSRWPQPTSIPA